MKESNPVSTDEASVELALENAVHLAEEVKHELSDMMKSSFQDTVLPIMKTIESNLATMIGKTEKLLIKSVQSLEKVESTASELAETMKDAQESSRLGLLEIQKIHVKLTERTDLLETTLDSLKGATGKIQSLSECISDRSDGIKTNLASIDNQLMISKKLLETLRSESIPKLGGTAKDILSSSVKNEEMLEAMEVSNSIVRNFQERISVSQIASIILGGANLLLLIWLLVRTFELM